MLKLIWGFEKRSIEDHLSWDECERYISSRFVGLIVWSIDTFGVAAEEW